MLSPLCRRVTRAIQAFGSERSVQVGRSLIALAQLSVLLLTSWSNLTPAIVGQRIAPHCVGVIQGSLFCLDHTPDALFARIGAVLACLLVISGFVPAISGVLHAWVSFSLSSSIGLPDGGESAAAVTTLIIAFVLLRDWRWNAWRHGPSAGSSCALDGVAWGSWWILRLQMAFIYLESGLSKFGTDEWVNGSALYYVVRDPSFGASGPVGEIARSLTEIPIGTALLTWGTIALEVAVGALLLGGPRARKVALGLVIALHLGIIVLIGLWSFATIMMGAVIVATAPERGINQHRQLLRLVTTKGGLPTTRPLPIPSG